MYYLVLKDVSWCHSPLRRAQWQTEITPRFALVPNTERKQIQLSLLYTKVTQIYSSHIDVLACQRVKAVAHFVDEDDAAGVSALIG